MKKLVLVLALASLPLTTLAQDWANVALLDKRCHAHGEDKNADVHTRECLLHCAKSGFGIIDAEGKWIALDKAGNGLALKAVQGTEKADHIRVNVSGELKGGTVAVAKLALAD